MNLQLRNISKSYNETLAVNNVDIDVPSGKILALVGPSGCGKTTILRIIAGLISPDRGQVILDDKDITGMPASKRPTVTVFQDYALFPHLNVFENIAYGLKTRHIKRREILFRMEQVLDMLKIRELKIRRIHELSGGQQQRVAVARALVVNPEVLLFDEPLSSLDAKLRVEMREEIKRIQQQTGVTAVYVTHDQEEALAIADQLAVMNEGRIEQVGNPEEVYHRPKTSFVGQFIGWGNLVKGEVISNGKNNLQVRLWGQVIPLNSKGAKSLFKNEKIQLFFRPESVEPHKDGLWTGEVLRKSFYGPVTRYFLKVESSEDENILMDLYAGNGNYKMGEKIKFNIKVYNIIRKSF